MAIIILTTKISLDAGKMSPVGRNHPQLRTTGLGHVKIFLFQTLHVSFPLPGIVFLLLFPWLVLSHPSLLKCLLLQEALSDHPVHLWISVSTLGMFPLGLTSPYVIILSIW